MLSVVCKDKIAANTVWWDLRALRENAMTAALILRHEMPNSNGNEISKWPIHEYEYADDDCSMTAIKDQTSQRDALESHNSMRYVSAVATQNSCWMLYTTTASARVFNINRTDHI